jgi:hypothetical protein
MIAAKRHLVSVVYAAVASAAISVLVAVLVSWWKLPGPPQPRVPTSEEKHAIEIATKEFRRREKWDGAVKVRAVFIHQRWSVIIYPIRGTNASGDPEIVVGSDKTITVDSSGKILEYTAGL